MRKNIFEEAVEAFQFEHEFRCANKKRPCNHLELIQRIYELEIVYKQNLYIKDSIKKHAIAQLNETKEAWLDTQNLEHGTFASWVDSVFNMAIKAVGELK